MRTRLLAALLALLAAVCLVVGLVSVVALRHYLLDQLDRQVTAAGGRSVTADGHPPDGGGSGRGDGAGPDFLLAPGQAEATLGVSVSGGRVDSAAVLDSAGTPRDVPAADYGRAGRGPGRRAPAHPRTRGARQLPAPRHAVADR